jgi:hypothetical protein
MIKEKDVNSPVVVAQDHVPNAPTQQLHQLAAIVKTRTKNVCFELSNIKK